jgi:hypothetical protein
MAMYTAYFTTSASAAVSADIPDEIAADGPDAISEWIAVNVGTTTLCHQCAHIDLGDWETVTVHDAAADSDIAEVTGPDGQTLAAPETGEQS